MLDLARQFKNFSQDGLELTIDIKTGEVFASQSALARMCQKGESTIRYFITSQEINVLTAQVLTSTGLKTSQILDEDGIVSCLAKYNAESLGNFVKLGLRVVLHNAVGYTHVGALRSSNSIATKEVELAPLEKPRLKLATKKLNLKQFVTTCKLFLDLVPHLDSNRKATLVFSAAKEAYPECAEIATMAQAALPPVAILEQSYTPTEIGSMLTPIVSARRVNTLIESAGLQESYQTARQQTRWKPTEAGREHSVLTIEAKHNGAPVESIRWKVSVLDLIILRATAINYLD